jgi:hypothetical protein
MASRLSVPCAGRFLAQRTSLVRNSLRGWADPRAIVRLQVLTDVWKWILKELSVGDYWALFRKKSISMSKICTTLYPLMLQSNRTYLSRPVFQSVLHRVKKERNILHTIRRRKANWIGHILRRNCLLIDIIEGKIIGIRRRGRRRKQLLDDWRKQEDTGSWSRKLRIALFGELSLEETIDLS